MHTFYIFFFLLQRKLNALPDLLDEIHDHMEIDSYYFRPGLRELDESQILGYFRSIRLSSLIGYRVRSIKRNNIIAYDIAFPDRYRREQAGEEEEGKEKMSRTTM